MVTYMPIHDICQFHGTCLKIPYGRSIIIWFVHVVSIFVMWEVQWANVTGRRFKMETVSSLKTAQNTHQNNENSPNIRQRIVEMKYFSYIGIYTLLADAYSTKDHTLRQVIRCHLQLKWSSSFSFPECLGRDSVLLLLHDGKCGYF